MRPARPASRAWWLEARRLPGRAPLAGVLARGVVSQEPADRLDLVAAEIVALALELLTPLLPQVVKQFPVARDDPDWLLEDSRDDSFRREFAQLQDERA
jgi:hypothetical protein